MLNHKRNQIAELESEVGDYENENASIAELLLAVQGERDDLALALSEAREREARERVSAQNARAFAPITLPREAYQRYDGAWEVHTLDDPPLFVDATWRDVPETSPHFNADTDALPVVWDDVFLTVQISAGESIHIPMERVTHIDERITPHVDAPPPPPPVQLEREFALGYE